MQSGFHIHQPPGLGVFHGFLEFIGNPRVVVFDDKLGHLRPFRRRQGFEFFDDFLRAHGCNYPQKFIPDKLRITSRGDTNSFPVLIVPWSLDDFVLKNPPGQSEIRRKSAGTAIAGTTPHKIIHSGRDGLASLKRQLVDTLDLTPALSSEERVNYIPST
jgi:hypothetical protein